MKKLQNDFTTPEQSKRLLELGVPADSADCYYSHYIKTYAHSEYTEILWHRPRFITEDNIPNWNARLINGTQTYMPCWSVGRLAEIYNIISMDYVIDELILNWSPFEYSYIEYIIDKLRENINHGLVDFSKLEE